MCGGIRIKRLSDPPIEGLTLLSKNRYKYTYEKVKDDWVFGPIALADRGRVPIT